MRKTSDRQTQIQGQSTKYPTSTPENCPVYQKVGEIVTDQRQLRQHND